MYTLISSQAMFSSSLMNVFRGGLPRYSTMSLFVRASSSVSSHKLERVIFSCARSGDVHTAMRAYRQLLADKGRVKEKVIGSLLHVCQETKEEQYIDEVIAAARRVPKIDRTLASKLIYCLVSFGKVSEAWEEYQKFSANGLKLRSSATHAMISATISHGELSSVLPLIRELEKERHPLEPWLAHKLLTVSQDDQNDIKEHGRQVFQAVVQLYTSLKEPVPVEILEPLTKWIERELGAAVRVTKVHFSTDGVCSNCQQQLNSDIDQEAYQQVLKLAESHLQAEVTSVVSSAKLVDRFISLLDNQRPFYAVVDGLNMAYQFGHFSIQNLRRVCDQLSTRGKVLVIARSHIANILSREEGTGSLSKLLDKYRSKNVHLFFLDHKWSDDYYFLYGCLYSGPQTLFVSNDSMGNHSEGMPPHLRRIFTQWLSSRQVKCERELIYPKPIPMIHHNHHSWHIPVCDSAEQYWLCVAR